MVVRRDVRKALRRLLCSRTGTAEIIGSVMFLLIMMFFFTNVFLWHDNATREMDTVLSDKMNSQVSIQVVNMSVTDSDFRLNVTNNGGVGVVLSRLWIIDDSGHHYYADLEKEQPIWVYPGEAKELNLTGPTLPGDDPEFSLKVDFVGKTPIIYYFPQEGQLIYFKILTTLGNMAACSSTPYR
jgi:archaellum component FlaF (FlaF/FlaG flagellin family)